MEKELPQEIQEKVDYYIQEGHDEVEFFNSTKAVQNYFKALILALKINEKSETVKKLNLLLGEQLINLKKYNFALIFYTKLENISSVDEYPIINFILGSCYFEIDNKEKAREYFIKDYELNKEKNLKSNLIYWIFFLNNREEYENKNTVKEELREYQGKKYTQEEWKKFEEEQFKEYARKNNIPLDKEEKPKKGGSFFLDEKESDF